MTRMSVFLMALAAWLVVRAGDRRDATGWMVAAGVALAVANAAAYSSALFDPIVVLLALLTAFPKPGRQAAAGRAAILLTVVVALLLAGLLIGGSSYLSGVKQTTLARAAGAASALSVLADAWSWTGDHPDPGRLRHRRQLGRPAGGARGPGCWRSWPSPRCWARLEQARLHTAASLNKHVGLGAWFAAIAAGYAVDRFIAAAPAGRMRTMTCGACVVALAFPVALGISQSRMFSTSWPNASSFIAIFRPLADHSTGRLLVEDPSIAEYYLPAGSQWQRWSSTRNIILPSGASTGGPSQRGGRRRRRQRGHLRAVHRAAYFSLVALNYRRHHLPGPPHRRRPAPQPALPRHPGRPLRHRDPAHRPGHLRDLAIRAEAARARSTPSKRRWGHR